MSIATAIVIFPLIPKALAIPSPAALQRTNRQLEEEIAAHERTLRELREIKAELEERVQDRTAEVEAANGRLRILTREVVHRSKNLMAVVQSLAYQTARTCPDKESFLERLNGRLSSLSEALDAVVRNESRGAYVEDLVRGQMAYSLDTFPGRIALDGPTVMVRPEAAQQLGLAIHELATNAVKHGALAGEDGMVTVSWRLVAPDTDDAPQRFALDWQETWPARPGRTDAMPSGFGTLLLERAVPASLRGTAHRSLTPEGLSYSLNAPTTDLLAAAHPAGADADGQAQPAGAG